MQQLILFCLQTDLMNQFFLLNSLVFFILLMIIRLQFYNFRNVNSQIQLCFFVESGTHKNHGVTWLLFLCLLRVQAVFRIFFFFKALREICKDEYFMKYSIVCEIFQNYVYLMIQMKWIWNSEMERKMFCYINIYICLSQKLFWMT